MSYHPVANRLGQIVGVSTVLQDVTERTRATGSLRKAHRRWQLVIESMNEGFQIRDENGILTFVNSAHCRLLGYRPDELIGMHSHKIVHESHLARAQEFSRRNDKTARYSTECNLKHKDGHAVPVILAAAPIRDESGQIHDRFAFVTDISEQKKHEMELSRAHDELEQRVLERTAELEQANARLHAEVAERQRAEQELISTAAGTGPDFFDSLLREFAKTIGVRYALVAEHLDAPVTRVRTLAVWADGQPGENFEYDVQGTPCDDVTQGLTRFYATGVCPLSPDDKMLVDMTAEGYCGIPLTSSAGQPIGHLVGIDVRPMSENPCHAPAVRIFAARAAGEIERRHADTERRETEQRLQSILDNTTAVVYAKDREGRYVLHNRRHEELFKFPPGFVLGKTDGELFSADVAAAFNAIDQDVWKSGQPVEVEEVAYVDGVPKTFISVKFLLTDEHGQPYALCGISTDITEWREAAEKINKHQDELAHVARLNTMGEMASGLAHELNQPLTSIVGYVQGCLRRLRSGDWKLEELLEILERAATQAMRGGRIISRIRKHVQSRDPQRDPVDINDAVREVVAMIERQAAMDEVQLNMELAEDLPELYTDRIQIEQVILNLTRNALESLGSVEDRQREITIRTQFDGNGAERITLIVADNGPGIDPSHLEQVFDQFFTTNPDGLGMGLAISQSIVEAHHGRMHAGTNSTGGATFRLSLPVSSKITLR